MLVTACSSHKSTTSKPAENNTNVNVIEQSLVSPISNLIPSGLDKSRVEIAIQRACFSAKWRITDKKNTSFKINFDAKGINLIANIEYDLNSYTISFDRLVSSTRDLDDTYAYYKRLISKLDRTIQKYLLQNH